MRLLEPIKKLSWSKKLLLFAVMLPELLFYGLVLTILSCMCWNRWDFAHRSGLADAEMQAVEKQSWQSVVAAAEGNLKYIRASKKILASINTNNVRRREKETAELRRLAAEHMKMLNRQNEILLQADDSDYGGYCSDALLLQAMAVRVCDLNQLVCEFNINAGDHFRQQYDDNAMYPKFYQLYERENKHLAFKYPDKTFKDRELCNLLNAMNVRLYNCGVEHGSFRLYQGDSPDSVRRGLDELKLYLLSDGNSKDPMRDVDIAYSLLARRDLQGSFCVNLLRIFTPAFIRVHYMNGHYLGLIAHQDAENHDFLSDPVPTNCKFAVIPYSDLWKQAQFLALSTDNFLWNIKFSNKEQSDVKLLKYRVRSLYDKNSPEMRAQRKKFAAALDHCIEQAGLKSLADNEKKLDDADHMPKAFVRMFLASKRVADVWDRYCQGKIDYKTFAADLRKREAEFDEARLDLLRRRWDDVFVFTGSLGVPSKGYVTCSLSYDGVNYAALEQLLNDKGRRQPLR